MNVLDVCKGGKTISLGKKSPKKASVHTTHRQLLFKEN